MTDPWIYTVWFRDENLLPDEQDHEWNAVIAIRASSSEFAKNWGDTLAKRRSLKGKDAIFLRSEVGSKSQFSGVTNWSTVPVVDFGQEVSDEVLGW